MKKYIIVLLLPLLLCFAGKAMSQVNQEEEVIIEKPAEDSADINTFYDDLSNDGEWIKVDKSEIDNDENLQLSESVDIDEDVIVDYIWRPSVSITLVDWSPYTYGHWEFCRFGWVWISEYNWGWGPYHYGRWWFSHRWGWVWSPGHRWAPSWVSWCHTRHHVGWHPISPRTPWRYHNGIIVTHPITPKQKSITNKWTFVDKKDFTKKITSENTIDLKKNKELVSDAKINASGKEVFNTGPKRKDIETSTGETISKKKVTFTNNTTKSGTNSENTKRNDPFKTNNNITKERQTKNDGTVKNKPQDTRKTKSDNGNNNTVKNPGTKKDNSNGNKNTKKEKSWISIGNENTKTRNSNSNNTYKSSNSNSNNTYKSSNSNSNNTYKSSNSNSNNTYKSSNSNSNNSYRSSNSNSNHSSNNNSSHNSSRNSSNSGNTSKSSNNKK